MGGYGISHATTVEAIRRKMEADQVKKAQAKKPTGTHGMGYQVMVEDGAKRQQQDVLSTQMNAHMPRPGPRPMGSQIPAPPKPASVQGGAPETAGPAALTPQQVAQNRQAALQAQISTIWRTEMQQHAPGTPGRQAAVEKLRALKAEAEMLRQSQISAPKFLSAPAAKDNTQLMLNTRRAEVQRRLAEMGQAPTAPSQADQTTAGKIELWKRGMGDKVLADKSGDLQRMAGGQFNPQQYIDSGGAYGTPAEKQVNAETIRRNMEKAELQKRLAEIDAEQADLDSGQYEARYADRAPNRQRAMEQAEVRRAAASQEADRLKASREAESAQVSDRTAFEKTQREIALKMQQAQLAKLQNDIQAQQVVGGVAPLAAQVQANEDRAALFYRQSGSGAQNRFDFSNQAQEAWERDIKPLFGGPLTWRHNISSIQSVDPSRVTTWAHRYVDPIERMASVNREEAAIAAKNLLQNFPAEWMSGQAEREGDVNSWFSGRGAAGHLWRTFDRLRQIAGA